MNQHLTNVRRVLDEVFNSENNLFIDSSYRNTVMYPNPNTFQIVMNQEFSHVQEVVLTHFIVNGGVVPGPYIYIIIDELQRSLCYNPLGPVSNYNFIIPGGISTYVSMQSINDKVTLPKQGSVNINTLTIRLLDAAGVPVVINDFVMKFYIRSYY